MDFTGEEKILMMLYSPGDRPGLYQALGEMRGQLEHDEKELRALTDRVMEKLEQMTDEAFDQLDLYSDIWDREENENGNQGAALCRHSGRRTGICDRAAG